MAVRPLELGLARGVHAGHEVRLRVAAKLRVSSARAAMRGQLQLDASNDSYLAPALALLPPGIAFEAPEDSELRKVVDALSRSQSRIGRKLASLQSQLLPGAPGELLEEWEELAGLEGDEETLDSLQAKQNHELIISSGGIASRPASLDERRARAVAQTLCDSQPFTLEELERRALETVIHRTTIGRLGTLRERVYRFSGIEVVQQQPFRAGVSCAGDAVYSHDWSGRFDITLDSEYGPIGSLASIVRARCRLLLDWLERVWPPWCALALHVRKPATKMREHILDLNCRQ